MELVYVNSGFDTQEGRDEPRVSLGETLHATTKLCGHKESLGDSPFLHRHFPEINIQYKHLKINKWIHCVLKMETWDDL